ncbi:MAG: hypothetical protein JXA99_11085 [Candidatus Lokiarchaeota archaeon]|nr:hypothetical protein [Candidatus Lokiarchaeota archaeon]
MIKTEKMTIEGQKFDKKALKQLLKIRESWESFSKEREIIPKPEKTMICKRCKQPR